MLALWENRFGGTDMAKRLEAPQAEDASGGGSWADWLGELVLTYEFAGLIAASWVLVRLMRWTKELLAPRPYQEEEGADPAQLCEVARTLREQRMPGSVTAAAEEPEAPPPPPAEEPRPAPG